MATKPNTTDVQATILAQTVIAANAAVAAQQAVEQASASFVPAPTGSGLPKNAYAFCFQRSGNPAAPGDVIDGTNIYPALWSNGGWLQGAAQIGTWVNISGVTLQDNDIGWFVRVT